MDQATNDKQETSIAAVPSIDFKMITFTLAGKDYSVDIMKVKEITKASDYTFVPNSAPFVLGVYNLRGDIISVIDLRRFFNLPVEEKQETQSDSIIILQLENHVIAIIVDRIDRVIGIPSEAVQPPHPIFGDINIKYISGIVENDGRLYVILDVESIFGAEVRVESQTNNLRQSSETPLAAAPLPADPQTPEAAYKEIVSEEVDIGFIEETLVTFLSFHASAVNQQWIRERFQSWKKSRGNGALQLTSAADAEGYLRPFPSPFSGTFWDTEYSRKISSFLNPDTRGVFQVWNPGCGSGYETYSLACVIKKTLPEIHLRIIAHDNDLINISVAPGLVAEDGKAASFYDEFLVEGTHEKQFSKEIKDAILFEYHDITHTNTLPKLDLVVMRDTVSYLIPEQQEEIFSMIAERMKPEALLLLGANELPINIEAWEKVEKADIVMYKKKKIEEDNA